MKEKQASRPAAVLLVMAVCMFLLTLSNGIRSNFGLIASALHAHTGLPVEAIRFAQAVAQLLYGLSQPFWGILALRKSNSFVLGLGGAIFAPFLQVFVDAGRFTASMLGLAAAAVCGALAAAAGLCCTIREREDGS